jgi:hypothetical protein
MSAHGARNPGWTAATPADTGRTIVRIATVADAAGIARIHNYQKHGQLDGEWRDCVIVEKLL